MSFYSRKRQQKIIRFLVRLWVKHKFIVIASALAVVAVSTCIYLIATSNSENVEVSVPQANMEDYTDIFGDVSQTDSSSKKIVTTTLDDGTVVEEETPTVLEYNKDTRPGYMNNCFFLGDSRLVAMVSYGFVSDSNVLAKIGVSHTAVDSITFQQNSGKQYTVKQYLETVKPPVVYVCYGVNGMNGISEEQYEKTYKELVEKIMKYAPDSKIVLMSIWPVDDNGTYKGKVKNEWIEKYNSFLLALAEYEGLYYLDVASVLKDKNGSIKPEFDGGDGLHYRASAYNTIIDYIIHHPVKGISDEGEFTVKYVKPSGEFKKIMTEQPKLPNNAVDESLITPTPTYEPENVYATTPTPTVTPTPIPQKVEPEYWPTLSPSPTPKITPTVTPTPVGVTPSPTETPTDTPTDTPAPTDAPTDTPAATDAPTDTPAATDTPTDTPTDSPAETPEASGGDGGTT